MSKTGAMTEPMNCPVCGSGVCVNRGTVGYFVSGDPKCLMGPCRTTEADAIAVWNRICVAVKAHDGLVKQLQYARRYVVSACPAPLVCDVEAIDAALAAARGGK